MRSWYFNDHSPEDLKKNGRKDFGITDEIYPQLSVIQL